MKHERVARLFLSIPRKGKKPASGFQNIMPKLHKLIARLTGEKGNSAVGRVNTFARSTLLLHYAARSGKIKVLKSLLKKKVSFNLQDACGQTSLMTAIRANKTNAALFLIENGADINMVDDFHNSALHIAVKENAPKVAKCLLEKMAHPNILNHTHMTPLSVALKHSRGTIAKLLAQYGGLDASGLFKFCKVLLLNITPKTKTKLAALLIGLVATITILAPQLDGLLLSVCTAFAVIGFLMVTYGTMYGRASAP